LTDFVLTGDEKIIFDTIMVNYTIYSLVIPMSSCPTLSDTLENLKLELHFALVPEQSFGNTNYYKARGKFGLVDNKCTIPDTFVRAFATN